MDKDPILSDEEEKEMLDQMVLNANLDRILDKIFSDSERAAGFLQFLFEDDEDIESE